MPRITPVRLLLLPPSCWFVLALLWVALPSPQQPWGDDPSDYLWRGGTLTRVYDVGDWWYPNEPNHFVQGLQKTGRTSFVLDYRYSADTGELSFGIGPTFKLPWHSNSSLQRFTSAPFLVSVKIGDQDGINMPWFTKADATLLFWEVRQEARAIPLRLQVKKESHSHQMDVLIWADSGPEDTVSDEVTEDTDKDWQVAAGEIPLLNIRFVIEDGIDYAIGGHPPFQVYLPTTRPSWSPSRTFFLRKAISTVLVSTAELVINILGADAVRIPIMFILGVAIVLIYTLGLYVLLILACWASKRFPPFWPWAQEYCLTNRLSALLVPTTSSLVESASSGDQNVGDDDAQHDDLDCSIGPQPLTGIWSFFTSKSPLDDLLVTFDSTKAFVQPLSNAWRRPPPADEENRHATSSGAETEIDDCDTRSRKARLHETEEKP